MTLQHKTFLMLFFVIIVIVGTISLVYNVQNTASLEAQLKSASMDMALTLSSSTQIQEALSEQENSRVLQEMMLPLMKSTRYQYIILMDMDGHQYSYPYESGLYKTYRAGGEGDVLNKGIAYASIDNNELISAVRAFAPIYHQGEQVGAVLVGLLTTTAKEENNTHVIIMELTLIFGIVIGLIIAIVFSMHIKKSTFGLEPKEIALLMAEKDLIFQNIQRGIIAVNNDQAITLMNEKANKLLDVDENQKNQLHDVSPYLAKLLHSISHKGALNYHESCILEKGNNILLHVCAIRNQNHEITGHVISMENLTEARRLAEEITGYQNLVDSLRAQNHEFMNRLQTISGLIQLEHYDKVLDFVEHQIDKNHHFANQLTQCIKVDTIAALILAKYELASEKKISFELDEDTSVTAVPLQTTTEDLCTLIGNLIDNSIDALGNSQNPFIYLYLKSTSDSLDLEITNNGPYLEEEPNLIFKKGYSTKDEHRGYGLHLVKSIVDRTNGKIHWINSDEEVTWFVKI